jgi:signal transduction histidine kinase/CheY-like chemotaxis protein
MTQKSKYDQQLLTEQVNHLYEQSHIASIGVITASIVTGTVFWPLVEHVNLILWGTAAILITLIRHFFIIRYRRSKVSAQDALRWKNIFIKLIFISGTIWGSSAIFIFPETSFPHQVFLSFILVGMVSGAIGTFSAILPAFLAYATPALLPLFIVFISAGTTIQQAMGGMILLYLALASVSAYHLFNKTRTTLKLQFENIDLIHFLEEEKHRTDTINKNLTEEVIERKRIEEVLKKHRENLECMVDDRTKALKESNIDLKIEIAERKRLEQQLFQAQKIEAIGTMAAGIAHDFNNILSGIQGNTSLALLNMDKNDIYYNKFKDIESYSTSGMDLTRQLLGFASSETSDPQPTDINQLIDDTTTMFCRTRKELRLNTSYNNINKVIEADSGQIRQAIINLLVNAWQAMPKGGEIDITTKDITRKEMDNLPYRISEQDYIKISISDSGIGMEPALVSKIFDPFFTTKKRGKGTGLGLSSVYGIIKSHDGYISVDSQPGRGSTFHIYLPVSHRQTAHILTPDNSIITGSETILIIDDEPDILEIGKEMLEVLGYQVHSAQNGKKALELYTQHKNMIHLVILDMIMPEMNGEQVYDGLLEINPDIRVLISSGYSQSGPAEKILKKGCNGFIQKPFKIQLLSQAIRKVLNAPV